MEHTGLRMRHRLRLHKGASFPVYLMVTATAVKTIRGKKTVQLRRRFYFNVVHIGDISRRKLMTEAERDGGFELGEDPGHEDWPFTIISQGMTMKLPDVLPQDYAMCEVHFGVTRMGLRGREVQDARDLLGIIGSEVQSQLDDVAKLCGGVPPFTQEQEDEARDEAEA